MKTLLLYILTAYKVIFSPLIRQLLGQNSMCRYEVSCSRYAKQAITKYGVWKGSKMALMRFLSCQPFINTKSYANI